MFPVLLWPKSEAPRKISEGEIHVWGWTLEESSAGLPAEVSLLDAEELGRFHRFRFDSDRARFAIAHANLRRILSAYLGRANDDLRFLSNQFGKPELAGESSANTIRFNLSHSRNIALLALSLGIEVGVDVEELRPIEPETAKHSFSPAELSALGTLQGEEWLQGFYRCWTRKEAILKGEGVGLNVPLDGFDVSLLPGKLAELLQTRSSARLHHRWILHDLRPAERAAAALAVASAEAKVYCFTLVR